MKGIKNPDKSTAIMKTNSTGQSVRKFSALFFIQTTCPQQCISLVETLLELVCDVTSGAGGGGAAGGQRTGTSTSLRNTAAQCLTQLEQRRPVRKIIYLRLGFILCNFFGVCIFILFLIPLFMQLFYFSWSSSYFSTKIFHFPIPSLLFYIVLF